MDLIEIRSVQEPRLLPSCCCSSGRCGSPLPAALPGQHAWAQRRWQEQGSPRASLHGHGALLFQVRAVRCLRCPDPRGAPAAGAERAASAEAGADTAYQAQTAVAHSNYHQALDVFHWFISIWQDLKFQGHKTQSYYFISGKCTATSLERCPFVIKGQVQRKEWRCGISSHHIPQPGGNQPITPRIAHFVSRC